MGLQLGLRWAGCFGVLMGGALSLTSCSEAADCDTSNRARSQQEQSSLGFSAKELLSDHPALSSTLQWVNASDWFSNPPSGATLASFTFEANGAPFESNSAEECSAYLGVPVTITLRTSDGALNATATGQLEAFSSEHLRLKAAFDANDIGGAVAPTGGVDLVVEIQVLGTAVEGTLVARRVRRTESTLSVTQDVVGTFTVAGDLPDAGVPLDAAASQTALASSVVSALLPPIEVPVSDAGAADAGVTDSGDGEAPDAAVADAMDARAPDSGSEVNDAAADADAN
jgi:hypothetical protein